jgi:hypothetical protein
VRALESTDLPLNCTKYGYFNLWKIVTIVATRCRILRLRCTKFEFRWASAPDPLGELTALSRPPSWILGGLLLRGGRAGEGRAGDRREGRGRAPVSIGHRAPQCVNPTLYTTAYVHLYKAVFEGQQALSAVSKTG